MQIGWRQFDGAGVQDQAGGKKAGEGAGLCFSRREEVELPENLMQDVYLRHPGDNEDGEEGEDQYDDEKGEESREVGSFNNFIASREIKLNDKIKDSAKS